MYFFWVTEGPIGQSGQLINTAESPDLGVLSRKFSYHFKRYTGKAWARRYTVFPDEPRVRRYEFVELDYGQNLHLPDLPDYTALHSTAPDEIKVLLDLALYGKVSTCNDQAPDNGTSWSPYTAPFNQLSRYTIYLAFRILKKIQSLLDSSGTSLSWKALQRHTTRYRKQIPLYQGHRIFTPVISSYKALYLELRLLYSLWPNQQEISRTVHVVTERAMVDWRFHGALALPWHHAYSSLSHGFRRLEDPTSTEYRELCQYLFGSNQPTHKMSFKIKDIYQVFVKTGARNAYDDWIQSREDRDTEERLLLWHGTRLSSLHGILDVGLQIRRRGVLYTGTMFGEDIAASRGQYRCFQGLGKSQPVRWKSTTWDMRAAPAAKAGAVQLLPLRRAFW
ncbi:uncharacterized protein B0I36DRAFT_437087 [Microdochium trichocladiopsis]|uniref:NAD(+) ADP-ribosyltransferase n=1 Tax=Microdochium trichocladiopsis TaxID=1682393 RepID=A0A9P9BH65_9PEZI|nr:uncharacterized protein B0I36DRAFT_437087 [Microdochium trichocladiopsis]KAH7009296.1 hypothetical protein B0I36DRAFT_437087 [Microdochium trichocladiopsis]